MSLVSIAWNYYANYPLILLANRDEFHDRMSEKLQIWSFDPVIYGGKDPKTGGTWLGMTETGKFAAITDLYHANEDGRRPSYSRAQLVLDYLLAKEDPEGFLEISREYRKRTMPFNFILGDHNRLFYCSSAVPNMEVELSPGIHSVADYFMDTPMPKCKYLKDQLEKRLYDNELSQEEREELFDLLARPMRFPDADLPHRGYEVGMERELSPIFLNLGDFGTVSSSIITQDHAGHVIFSERSYQANETHTTHSLEFDLVEP